MSECWAGCLAATMADLTSSAESMAEMQAYLKLKGVLRAANSAWQTVKDLSKDGYCAAMMGVVKDALMHLAFRLAAMLANPKMRDLMTVQCLAYLTARVSWKAGYLAATTVVKLASPRRKD